VVADCGRCNAPTDLVICWNCAKVLRRQLIGSPGADGDVPGIDWYLIRLEQTAYGGARLGGQAPRTSATSDHPVSFNARAAGQLRETVDKLDEWVHAINGGDLPVELRPPCTVPAAFIGPLALGWRRLPTRWRVTPAGLMAHYLARHMSRLMVYDGAAAMSAELDRRVKACDRIINRPLDVYLGPCPTEFVDATTHVPTGEVCATELRAEKDETTVTCKRCRMVHQVEHIRQWALERVDDEPKSATEMLKLLKWLGTPVPPRSSFYALVARVTPRMYRHRDQRITLRREKGSVALYAYSDVVEALTIAAAARARTEERRTTRRTRRRPRRDDQVSGCTN